MHTRAAQAVRDKPSICVYACLTPLFPCDPRHCGNKWVVPGLLIDAPWPSVDESALVRDSIELVVQVNGKVRGRIRDPVDVDQDTAQAIAMDEPNVSKFLDGLTIRKVILIPGRLLNLVAN